MRLEELRKELAGLKDDKISWMKTDPNMVKIKGGPGRSIEKCGLGPGRDRFSRAGPGDRFTEKVSREVASGQGELAAGEKKGRRRCQRMDR